MEIHRWLLVGIAIAAWVSGARTAAPAALPPNPPPSSFDLTGPDFNPPDGPVWAQETLPAWLTPFVGKNGQPAQWRPRNRVGSRGWRLIVKHGYHRRDQEFADAEAAFLD